LYATWQVWDEDLLTFDDFIGECTFSLAMLMDGRTHRVCAKLCDPDGMYEGEEVQGEIFLELRYAS
jgi:hypothetical protein